MGNILQEETTYAWEYPLPDINANLKSWMRTKPVVRLKVKLKNGESVSLHFKNKDLAYRLVAWYRRPNGPSSFIVRDGKLEHVFYKSSIKDIKSVG